MNSLIVILRKEDRLNHRTQNNTFDNEEIGSGFYCNSELFTFCLMLFIISFIIPGLFSVGTKFFKDSNISIEVPIAIDQQRYSQEQSQVSLVKSEVKSRQAVVLPVKKEKSIVVTIKHKDNLPKIFKHYGLSAKDASAILAIKQAKVLKNLHVGKKIDLVFDSGSPKLKKLIYVIDDFNTLAITPSANNSWSARIKHIEPTSSLRYTSATVTSSIYTAARKAGVSRNLLSQLMGIFGNKDSFKKMRRGDRFAVFYKEYVANGKKIKEGEIAAAEFVHNGQIHRLIGFTDPNGNTNYYTPEGMGITPPFVRYPLKYDRIGSRFSLSRYQPILHVVRPHNGVDLAVRAGTPIKATGGGIISFVGNKSGYGRTVIMKHGSKYSTLYAHLLDYSNKACSGCYVKRGEVIGYVGSSGLSTAPHLHYEFHINGVPHDPLKVKLPDGEMIAAEYRKSFFTLAKKMLVQLELCGRDHRMLAMVSSGIS